VLQVTARAVCSEGFNSAPILSRKMVKLYQLASEQLSKQGHYDFGMRALKSVLVMAGGMKRAHPGYCESATLIRAMRDANIPKCLTADAELFDGILQVREHLVTICV
jgi:dynein heavy chain, axonemal